MSIDKIDERAKAGLEYAAFEHMYNQQYDQAMQLIGTLAKYLLAGADVSLPPEPSELTRLIEEALEHVKSNPAAEW
jgi:hypothetical protein